MRHTWGRRFIQSHGSNVKSKFCKTEILNFLFKHPEVTNNAWDPRDLRSTKPTDICMLNTSSIILPQGLLIIVQSFSRILFFFELTHAGSRVTDHTVTHVLSVRLFVQIIYVSINNNTSQKRSLVYRSVLLKIWYQHFFLQKIYDMKMLTFCSLIVTMEMMFRKMECSNLKRSKIIASR